MFTIRGENVYPSEIDAALNELPDYGGEHRILISREATMDELLLRVEHRCGDLPEGRRRNSAFRARNGTEAAEGPRPAHRRGSRRTRLDRADGLQGAAGHRRQESLRDMQARWKGRGLDPHGVPSADLVTRVQAGDVAADRPPDLAGGAVTRKRARRSLDLQARPAARTSSASPACRAAASRRWSPSWRERLRQAAARWAIVAIDPSSPYSGGAILGDRIRMGEHGLRPGRLHALDGDAWRVRRPCARGARRRRHSRRGRFRNRHHRDRRRRPGRGRDRAEPRTRPSSSRPRVSATTSRPSRPAFWRSPTSTSCQQMRSRRRQPDDRRSEAACSARRWRRNRRRGQSRSSRPAPRPASDSTSLLDAIERASGGCLRAARNRRATAGADRRSSRLRKTAENMLLRPFADAFASEPTARSPASSCAPQRATRTRRQREFLRQITLRESKEPAMNTDARCQDRSRS